MNKGSLDSSRQDELNEFRKIFRSFFTPEGARHITGGKVFGGQYTPEEFPLQTKGAEIGQGYYQSARPTKGNNSVDSAPVLE
ncbi:unnamed protein product [Rhizophagus irregularis]|nr:unnamed protein product [Rhizophagus irregularis]